jgi:hypothetical protein
VTAAARALLGSSVDYAGLFPPAGLSMSEAVRLYAEYVTGPHAWMVGRFVVPAARLAEFARSAESVIPAGRGPWRVSVVLSSDADAGMAAVAAFNASHGGAVCDTLECKASTTDDIARLAWAVHGGDAVAYVELPVTDEPARLIGALSARGLRAKIRMGGTTPDAFPSAANVARFLAACVRAGVPFKATAGLHHPVGGDYRLTYDAASGTGPMFGFLNMFLATALLRDGGNEQDAEALLTERVAAEFRFGDQGVLWRGRLLLTARLAQLRDRCAASFGSCSFAEPIDELSALGIL